MFTSDVLDLHLASKIKMDKCMKRTALKASVLPFAAISSVFLMGISILLYAFTKRI